MPERKRDAGAKSETMRKKTHGDEMSSRCAFLSVRLPVFLRMTTDGIIAKIHAFVCENPPFAVSRPLGIPAAILLHASERRG